MHDQYLDIHWNRIMHVQKYPFDHNTHTLLNIVFDIICIIILSYICTVPYYFILKCYNTFLLCYISNMLLYWYSKYRQQ